MPEPSELFDQLAALAIVIENVGSLQHVCASLESGRLNQSSSAATRAAIAGGHTTLEASLRVLQELWAQRLCGQSGQTVALVLQSGVATARAFRKQVPATQVVWSGPKIEGSFLRATREVVRELLRNAQRELLVVGYWIAAHDEGDGIIEEFVASLAAAVERGIVTRVIFDERVRPDGRDNRQVLISAWPAKVLAPKMLTWRLPQGDQHLKLHAKVLVADRSDALVTSANLTFYAMDRNMEMGVRIIGSPAAEIVKHFDLLVAKGVLEPFAELRDVS